MDEFKESESGFIEEPDKEFAIATGITDVEILHFSKINIIACGRRFGRKWLLKGLRPELRESPTYRRQLQKEFEIHSRLHNPAVVQAVGFEEVEGLGRCIVEEWIEGKSLHRLLQEGKISKEERKRIMREIILATDYLHSQGVIHRDLKPSNVMIRNAGGSVVLIDFGLADTDDYVELKQSAGTPGFISPEQENDASASVTDDIYSLGAIMKELCPEYNSIASRCADPLDKRPKDAKEVLKMIKRKDLTPRVIGISLGMLIICVLAIFAALRIHSLSRSAAEAESSIVIAQSAADDARRKVTELRESNHRQAAHVAQLKDSLQIVNTRMSRAEQELKATEEYAMIKEKAYRAGCLKIDYELQRFDKNAVPVIIKAPASFIDSIASLNRRLKSISDTSAETKIYPELTDTDRRKIREDIYYYAMLELPPFQEEWMKEVYPSYR